MSVSSTRKVSSSTGSQTRSSAVKHAPSHYANNSEEGSFVEIIDTSNNISINNQERDNNNKNNQNYKQPEKEGGQDLSRTQTYIPSAIEALSASGVYDENPEKSYNTNKVNVYGNNQSIIKDEEVERTGHNYLKHFYEKNELIEEVNELV